MTKLNEKILLYKLRTQQDPESFAALYDLYVKQIYRFVFFKVSSHEEAEDIASEVFLKAWHFLLQHKKPVVSFRGLLYRIARNCVIDVYRARSAKPEVILGGDEQIEIGDKGKWFAELHIKLDAEKIVQALKKLKQEYQEVITLRYVDELDINEIAEIVGKGSIAVRVTLHRALRKLKDVIGDEKKLNL